MDSNNFSMKEYPSDTLVGFFGGQHSKLSPIEQNSQQNIVREMSEWDNDFNIYGDFVDMFMKWDSVMVNTGGVIDRRLMSVVNINVDNVIGMSTSDTTKSAENNMTRYLQLCGAWYITKIRYIIKANRGIFK